MFHRPAAFQLGVMPLCKTTPLRLTPHIVRKESTVANTQTHLDPPKRTNDLWSPQAFLVGLVERARVVDMARYEEADSARLLGELVPQTTILVIEGPLRIACCSHKVARISSRVGMAETMAAQKAPAPPSTRTGYWSSQPHPSGPGASARALGEILPVLKPTAVLGDSSPVLGTRAPVLGDIPPVLEPSTAVLGDSSPVLGTRTPVLGDIPPVLEPSTAVLGDSSPVLGTRTPVLGDIPRVLEPSTAVLGDSSPVLDARTRVLGDILLVLEPSTAVLGDSSPVLGARTRVLGDIPPVLEPSTAALGDSSVNPTDRDKRILSNFMPASR